MKKKFNRTERLYNNLGKNSESEKIKEEYIKEKIKKIRSWRI